MVEVTGHGMLAVRAVMAAKWPRDRAAWQGCWNPGLGCAMDRVVRAWKDWD